jgi:multiple sugar transport system permease protein
MATLPSARKKLFRLSQVQREEVSFHLFTLPWLLGFIFLTATPLVMGLYLSFTNYTGLNWDSMKFVGLANYVKAFTKEDLIIAARNSFRYSALVVPVGISISLLLAVLLNQPVKGRGIFRTLLYIPSILPITASTWAWRLVGSTYSGLANGLISLFVPGTAINWFHDHYFLILYLFAWWGAGGGMVIFLSGLQGIPTDLYEAAAIDGANKRQVFFRVTLPLMTPVIFFQLITGIIGSLQLLSVPLLLAGSGAMGSSSGLGRERYVYMVYQYLQIFDYQRFGYGVALAWLLFAVVLILTIIVMVTSKYWVYYEVSQEGEER